MADRTRPPDDARYARTVDELARATDDAIDGRWALRRLFETLHVLGAAVPLRVLVPLPDPDARGESSTCCTRGTGPTSSTSASTRPGWTSAWRTRPMPRPTDLVGLAGAAVAIVAVVVAAGRRLGLRRSGLAVLAGASAIAALAPIGALPVAG